MPDLVPAQKQQIRHFHSRLRPVCLWRGHPQGHFLRDRQQQSRRQWRAGLPRGDTPS